MTGWNTLPQTTHRAAIAGKVVDAETRQPVSGVDVALTAMPAALKKRLELQALQHGAAWERLAGRPDRTRTAEDGCFRFVDLPKGAYTLAFTLAGGKHRYGTLKQEFQVKTDAKGQLQPTLAEVLLPPTGVKGQVQGLVQGTPTALPLALIRVQSSGERTYGDAQGRFYLTGLETGPRLLQLSAEGFRSATAPALISEGTITQLAPIVLEPATA
jgi:hypothetical protein